METQNQSGPKRRVELAEGAEETDKDMVYSGAYPIGYAS